MERNLILLVEDDFLNRRLSKKILSENGYNILEAKNTGEALAILENEKADLAILDINLGENEQNGISLGQELQEKYVIPFLYLTAYDNADIVTKAVNTIPYAYITKPFKNVDLLTTVALAILQAAGREKQQPAILVKDGAYNLKLPLEEINYIESDGNYLLFHTSRKIYKNRSTIRQILEQLPVKTFIQTHRAFVVNKTKISKFNIKSLIVNEETIPVSKNFIEDIDAIR